MRKQKLHIFCMSKSSREVAIARSCKEKSWLSICRVLTFLQVHKLTERASQDIRFDEPLADACFEDRVRLCPGVQPVRSDIFYAESWYCV